MKTVHATCTDVDGSKTHHLFCYAALADKHKTTVYLNAAGRFPCTLMNGKQYMLVTYDYMSKAIIIETMKNLEADTICATYK